MILLVGLGNPGGKYAQNRHNAGFHAVTAVGDAHDFGPERKKFNGRVREGTLGGARAMLLLPETFYNESGNAVAAAAKFYKIPPGHIIVFHDEIDLAPGKVRTKKGGGLAGNNGLRSTAAHLGPDFWRVRIGIGHPGRKEAVTPFVLGDFSKAERQDYYDRLIEEIGRHAGLLVDLDDTAAGRFMSAIVQPGAKTAQPSPTAESAPRPAPAPGPNPPQQTTPQPSGSPFDVLKGLKGSD